MDGFRSAGRLFTADRGGRTVHLRPGTVESTRAMLGLGSAVRGLDRLGRHAVTTVPRATWAGELRTASGR